MRRLSWAAPISGPRRPPSRPDEAGQDFRAQRNSTGDRRQCGRGGRKGGRPCGKDRGHPPLGQAELGDTYQGYMSPSPLPSPLCYNRRVKKRKRAPRTARTAGTGRPRQEERAAVEITGVVLIFLAFFALISVLSYDAAIRPSPMFPRPATASAISRAASGLFRPGHPVVHRPGRVRPPLRPRLRRPAGCPARHLGPSLEALGHDRPRPAHRLPPLGPHLRILPLPWQCHPGRRHHRLRYPRLPCPLPQHRRLLRLPAGRPGHVPFVLDRWSLGKTLRFAKGAFDSTAREVRIRVTDHQKTKAKDRMREKVRQKYEPPPAEPARPDPRDEKAARKAEKEAERERRRLEKEAASRPSWPLRCRPSPSLRPKPEPLLFPDLGRKGDYQYPPFTLLEPGKPAEKVNQTELFDKKNGSRRSSRSSASRARSASTTPARSSRPTSTSPPPASRSPRSPT